MLDQAKAGKATAKQLFDYYLGCVTDPNITTHFQFIPTATSRFDASWGMNVEVEDLGVSSRQPRSNGGKVVLGGHSLGGSMTTAYATWDFNGKPGAKDLSGLVFIDGGSSPTPATPRPGEPAAAGTPERLAVAVVRGIAAPLRRLVLRDGCDAA